MDQALNFFKSYETAIYVLLGLGGMVQLRRFYFAWEELRGATFGLIREQAQSKLNQSAAVLTLIIVFGIGLFIAVTYIAPARIIAQSQEISSEAAARSGEQKQDEESDAGVSESSNPDELSSNGLAVSLCSPGEAEISFPSEGDILREAVQVVGTANIENFGFYKFDVYSYEADQWINIQAGNTPVVDGQLINIWDVNTLDAGQYLLRLNVQNNEGEVVATCQVGIRIEPEN